jgi:hypothetical protein
MYCEEIIDRHGLVIGTDDRPTHYRMRNKSNCESISDLALANRPFGQWTLLDGSNVTGSVHEIID